MKYRMILSAFFLFLLTNTAHAEYRVFVLKISKRAPASAPGAPPAATSDYRLVQSTLDPEQYRGYYTVLPDEDITYIQTWRCFGRTSDFKEFCPNPKAQNAVKTEPAS